MVETIRLEDNFEDIIGKAAAGLGVGNLDLAQRTGLDADRIRAVMGGRFDGEAIVAAATALGLHGPSLLELAKRFWRPKPVDLEGLRSYTTPYPVPGYEEMTVNAYLAYDAGTREAVVFDSGASVEAMLGDIERLGLKVQAVLLTHTHGDHVQALDELLRATGYPEVWSHEREPYRKAHTFQEGHTFSAGGLGIQTRLTSGHSPGGTTYVIEGLTHPVAVVGDALFCGSVGGARGAFQRALDQIRKQILTLPDETVICPGHGPMSTVAEEKARNPFFPEFKPA